MSSPLQCGDRLCGSLYWSQSPHTLQLSWLGITSGDKHWYCICGSQSWKAVCLQNIQWNFVAFASRRM